MLLVHVSVCWLIPINTSRFIYLFIFVNVTKILILCSGLKNKIKNIYSLEEPNMKTEKWDDESDS